MKLSGNLFSQILVCVCCISFGGSAISAQDLIERTQMKLPPKIANGISQTPIKTNRTNYQEINLLTLSDKKSNNSPIGEIYLDLDTKALKSLKVKSKKKISIPVSSKHSFDLLLSPVEVLSPSFKVINENGVELDVTKANFYKGKVSDDPTSMVSMTVSDNTVRILISDKVGNYNLGLHESNGKYVLYNDANLGTFPFTCQNDDLTLKNDNFSKKIKSPTQKAANAECVKVYVEADYTTFLNFGSSEQAVTNFILGTFHEVATLYDAIGINIQLSALKIWTNDDPYEAQSNVSSALSYLSAHQTAFNGDLFHLVSAIGNCCSWNGVAYVSAGNRAGLFNRSTVCGPNPYAVSQTSLFYESLPTYSWSVNVFAHEMGHNMGAPHTHECAWGEGNLSPIDGCGPVSSSCANPGLPHAGQGTIMSYCHTIGSVGISLANGFHPEVAAHLQSEYQSRACLTTCGPIYGCTDPTSHGFNPLAVESDGSCSGTCGDGIQNGDETGVDCGGILCPSCDFICYDNYLRLSITFDDYAAETSWEILDGQGNRVLFGNGYSSSLNRNAMKKDICLPNGDYTLVFKDSYGDGMCCSYGNGAFWLMDREGNYLATGGTFESSQALAFTLNNATCSDGIQNRDETGVDCGGEYCPPCAVFIPCDSPVAIEQEWMEGFEESWGNWHQSIDDDFDWTRTTNATPSVNTGPTKASEGNYYIYVEASNSNNPIKRAGINSPCLFLMKISDPSFRFDYHMHGSAMGQLEVVIENLMTNEINTIWSLSGEQGDQWHTATIDLESYKFQYIKISLIATTGNGFSSDIALDHIGIISSTDTCNDGIKNGNETGVDCGGSMCVPCQSCQESEWTIAQNEVISGSQQKIIKNKITTSANVMIDYSANIMWQAGTSIEINSSFEVMPGAELLLTTQACDEP